MAPRQPHPFNRGNLEQRSRSGCYTNYGSGSDPVCVESGMNVRCGEEEALMTKEKNDKVQPLNKDHYRDTNGAHVAADMEQNKCSKCYCYCYSDCHSCFKMKRRKTRRKEQEKVETYRYYNHLSESAKVGLCHMVIFLLAGSIYLNTLSGDFVHDDVASIVRNPDVNLAKWTNNNNNNINSISSPSQEQDNAWWWSVWKNDYWGMPMSSPLSHKSYRPLTVLTFRLNFWMCGNSLCPEMFHATNVLIHALVSSLTLHLCQAVLKMRLLSSILTSLIFALHPIHTEAVAGITGRADALACLMMLTSFLLYHKLLESQRQVLPMSNQSYCCYCLKKSLDCQGENEDEGKKCEIIPSSFLFCNFDDPQTGNPGNSSVDYDILKECNCHKSSQHKSFLASFFPDFFPFSKINAVLFLTSGLVGCAAMLAKETGITILGINLLYDFYLHLQQSPNRVTNSQNLRCKNNNTLNRDDNPRQHQFNQKHANALMRYRAAGILALVFISLTLRITLMNGTFPRFGRPDNPAAYSESELTRLLTYAYLPVLNMWLMIHPRTLSYDWQMGSIPLVQSIWDPRNFASAVFYLAIFLLTWKAVTLRKSKSWPSLVLAQLFIVIPFVPASNLLFPVGFVVAERVLYMPSMGVCILVVHGMESLLTLGRRFVITTHLTGKSASTGGIHMLCNLLVAIMTCILLLSFGMRTWQRNAVWQSRLTLFTSGIRDVPQNAKMHYNYANLQKDGGNQILAIQHYSAAIRLWPEYASAHNNLGTLLMGNPAAAEHQFLRAIHAGNQAHGGAHFNLGVLYMQNEKYLEAASHFKKSLIIDPSHHQALDYLTLCRNMIQQMREQEQQPHQDQNSAVNVELGNGNIENNNINNNNNSVNSTSPTTAGLNHFSIAESRNENTDLNVISSHYPVLEKHTSSAAPGKVKSEWENAVMIIKSSRGSCSQNFSSPWKFSPGSGNALDKLLPSHVHYFHNSGVDKS